MSPDTDGYPTEEELRRIREWPSRDWSPADLCQWFALIRSCWWAADWGWSEDDYEEANTRWHRYRISTGGWSGNEAIIDAMQATAPVLGPWARTWQSSRRGGHYEFAYETTHPKECEARTRA